jgi:protein-disulfide isomerase
MTVRSLLVTVLLCVYALGSRAQGPLHQDETSGFNRCPSLSDADRARIIVYLSKWLEVENLSIESDEIIPGTCYRKLGIKGAAHPTFFLSADQRFLSGSLLDTAVDPEQQRKIAQEEANRILLADPSPSRGAPSASAPVTIVEFGDFQCSYCKKFHELLASQEQVRLVFKHLPIQGHTWAHDSAAFAVCADAQSSSAFWQLHDFFFENQATLTASNLEARTMEFVGSLTGINGSRLLECVHSGQAEAKIVKDTELAKEFRVNGTPTIFVNGRRGGVIQSQDDLNNLVKKAHGGKNGEEK